MVKRSVNKLEKGELQESFKLAVQAVNIAPDNIEARLNLSKIQLEKGYYDDALIEIEKLYNANRSNVELQYSLIETYIKMFKFNKAFRMLDLVEDKQNSRFSYLKSKVYERDGDMNLALSWLKKSIDQNKLNEESIYLLAKSYIKYHK